MGTFTVLAAIRNPTDPESRLTIDLLVDTGATWTLLPAGVVARLGLATPRSRTVELASGDRVVYPMGQVVLRLDGEELTTIFLAGPADARPLLGVVTLEEFGLAPDPVRKVLVPVTGLLASAVTAASCSGRTRRSPRS